jgi:hypothetical protein
MNDPYAKPDQVLQSQLNKSRKDKFLLVLNLPPALKNIQQQNLRDNNAIQQDTLQFSVYGTLVPEITVPEKVAGYSNQSYKVSSNSREPYPNISVNFTIDNRFNNYWVIYKWLALLNDPQYSLYNADKPSLSEKKIAPELYQTDFTVYAKDEFDQNIVKFTYTKAFPVKLGSIDYSYRDEAEIETTFEFAFSQFFTELV